MSFRKLIAASALSLMTVAAWAADVSGTWTMTVETQAGTGSPTFVLKQDGEKVSGTYKGQLGEAPVTGTVKGNNVDMGYKISAQGVDIEVKYIGTIDGKNMSGKVSLGELGEGTFKGTKQ